MMTDAQWDRLERILRKVIEEDRQRRREQREKDKTFWAWIEHRQKEHNEIELRDESDHSES